jgi:hypothetical protein
VDIIIEPVNTYRVRADCKCGGEYKFSAVSVDGKLHVCDTCEDGTILDEEYPRIVHVPQTHMPLTTAHLGTSLLSQGEI